MTVLHLDLETRSTVDLTKTGVYRYAEDPTTDVWCACYAFDDDPVELWTPAQPTPPSVRSHVQAGGRVYAHNAAFERIMWRGVLAPRYGWPEPDLEQWRCTMAMALAMGLPGKLEHAAPAAGLDVRKDAAGHRLMLQMCKPRNPRKKETPEGLLWWEDEERREKLYAYCRQDVVVERMLEKRLMALSKKEQDVWFLDQRINDRGIAVDRDLAEAAKIIVRAEEDRLDRALSEATGGAVIGIHNTKMLAEWLRSEGLDVDSVNKAAVGELLARGDLAPHIRVALELRKEGGKTSVAKIDALLKGAGADDRLRGTLQFCAAHTRRWGGRLFQPQNILRPLIKDVDFAIEAIKFRDPEFMAMVYDNPLDAVSSCTRGMLVARRGRKVHAGDFANIEGRKTAWFAGERWKLDAFRAFDRGDGPDLYLLTASDICGEPVEKITEDQRQAIGKVPELALGFGGGVGAFVTMAKTYGVDIAAYFDILVEKTGRLDRAENAYDERGRGSGIDREAWIAAEMVKLAWRAKHPKIVNFWRHIEDAVRAALASPGSVETCGRVAFRKSGSFLWCKLPSGGVICYPYARIDDWLTIRKGKKIKTLPRHVYEAENWSSWDVVKIEKSRIVYQTTDPETRQFGWTSTYGGKLTENVVQASARDVLADAMIRLDEANFDIVMTVHDEVVVEDDADDLDLFLALMSERPRWSPDLPIAVKGYSADRYRKG